MTPLPASRDDTASAPAWQTCLAILAVVTLVRLVGLSQSAVDFYVDESQYWAWSRAPAFGYFSKPPLLAWIIGAAEAVCGSAEACLRAPAPIFYFATSLAAYAVAYELYGSRIAFWTAMMVTFTTGTAFSARIISTDVPLIFCWTVALLAYVRLLRGRDWRWAIMLGLALGLGLLAKYAMIYFLLGIALAAALDAQARDFLKRRDLPLALAIAGLCIAPNLLWNAENGFATFKHTGDNIEGAGLRFSAAKGFEFLAAQFAVFGPVIFGGLLVLAARLDGPKVQRPERLLMAFSIPILALVAATAFVTRAHPNWAATAFVAAAIAVTAMLVRANAWRWIAASLGIGLAAQTALLVADPIAGEVRLPLVKRPDVYERTLGWRALGEQTARLAAMENAAAVVSDNRSDVSSLLYYMRDTRWPIFAWPPGRVARNHFELTRPLAATGPEPVLFVSQCPSSERFLDAYRSVRPVGTFDAPTGPTTARRYHAVLLAEPRGALGPVPPCPG